MRKTSSTQVMALDISAVMNSFRVNNEINFFSIDLNRQKAQQMSNKANTHARARAPILKRERTWFVVSIPTIQCDSHTFLHHFRCFVGMTLSLSKNQKRNSSSTKPVVLVRCYCLCKMYMKKQSIDTQDREMCLIVWGSHAVRENIFH